MATATHLTHGTDNFFNLDMIPKVCRKTARIIPNPMGQVVSMLLSISNMRPKPNGKTLFLGAAQLPICPSKVKSTRWGALGGFGSPLLHIKANGISDSVCASVCAWGRRVPKDENLQFSRNIAYILSFCQPQAATKQKPTQPAQSRALRKSVIVFLIVWVYFVHLEGFKLVLHFAECIFEKPMSLGSWAKEIERGNVARIVCGSKGCGWGCAYGVGCGGGVQLSDNFVQLLMQETWLSLVTATPLYFVSDAHPTITFPLGFIFVLLFLFFFDCLLGSCPLSIETGNAIEFHVRMRCEIVV